MRTSKWLTGVLLIGLIFGLMAVPAASAKEPIKIGAIVELTGEAAEMGIENQYTIEVAESLLNAGGGIEGCVIVSRPGLDSAEKLKGKTLGTFQLDTLEVLPYDWLKKPFGVAFDPQGRVLVTDSALGALFRFDRPNEVADVFGTRGAVTLKAPLGLGVGPDGTAYVADVGQDGQVGAGPAAPAMVSFQV